MKKCKYCGFDLSLLAPKERPNHVRWCTKNPNLKVKDKTKKCKFCGDSFIGKRLTCNKKECIEMNRKHSEDTKKKISDRMKSYLLNNPDKHSWKKNLKKSKPCENVKNFLRNRNMSFVEEWNPISNRNFAIDIAFPDIKLGIEINGNQHYNNDGTLKKYYQERHNIIESNGWKLIEIHYSLCFNEKVLEKIIKDYQQSPDYSFYFKLLENKKNKKEKLMQNSIENKKIKLERKRIKEKIKESKDEADIQELEEKLSKLRTSSMIKMQENNRKKWQPYFSIIENSNIDFSKFGWVKKVSDILGITPQKTRLWIKRYFPNIYKSSYRRKSS